MIAGLETGLLLWHSKRVETCSSSACAPVLEDVAVQQVLQLEHVLSQVELLAWGRGMVAGVRLGDARCARRPGSQQVLERVKMCKQGC
jgi:hypothetical protein